MKWFKRWFSRMSEQAWYDARAEHDGIPIKLNTMGSNTGPNTAPNLMFKMYRANNGFVMEVGRQDKRTHDTSYEMYLIADGEDLGDNISKIITMETLRC
jgi:hypothetical protein